MGSSLIQSAITSQVIPFDLSFSHPSAHLSRKETTEVERQNININTEYGESIDLYMRELETMF